ncbi:MAG: HlyC/CorC family transporter [Candidatus Cloacimonetes bacterium]|nr:HlyC/CorC family transporter [Candidatus Cloacimonadota bacterium]
MEIILAFLTIIIALAFSFLFSGLESGLISLNHLLLENSARKDKNAEKLLKFIQRPDKFLGTTLIGNNIFNVILASVTTYYVKRFISDYPFVNLNPQWTPLFMGFVVLVFGEIIPKAIFRDHADTLVPKLFPLLNIFYNILRPFVAAVTKMNSFVQKLLKIEGNYNMFYLTRDDLAFLLSQTDSDAVSETHLEMIEDALEFNEQKARNVMVPRTDIVGIAEETPIPEVLEIARKEGFTRYPVFSGTLDNIIGVLIIYDIIRIKDSEQLTAGKLKHEPLFIPENTDVDVLLKEMQKHHKSMAIIVDSFGGTAGIVTMEDILEEIVGEIGDEFDTEEDVEADIEQVGPNTWIVAADVEIDMFNDEYEMDLPTGDYETVAGLILDALESIPVQGQILHCGKYRLQVLQATDKKIIRVKIHLTDEEETSQ